MLPKLQKLLYPKFLVLISSMQGFGDEITKNLVLVDVKSITLHDKRGVVELGNLPYGF